MQDIWEKVEGMKDIQLREKIKNMITVFKYVKNYYKGDRKQLFFSP